MSKTTLSDVIAKERKDISFEDRIKGFEAAVKPLCEEWGVSLAAILVTSQAAIVAQPAYQDLFSKHG